ncbi:MAG: hypothetical protein KC492_40300 [Myxococcales bacterium]|nr:hypothetical protein [Myxococcales bacterium]
MLSSSVVESGRAQRHGRIKGVALREFVNWVEQNWGRATLDAALSKLPPRFGGILNADRPGLGLLAASWYDGELGILLLEALFDGRSEQERNRAIAEATQRLMEANLGSVYKRFFIRLFLSPQQYVVHCQKLWALHFDTGEIDAQFMGPTKIRWRIAGWRTYHPYLCRFVISSEPAVFGAMGCKQVRATATTNEPGYECSHFIEWD